MALLDRHMIQIGSNMDNDETHGCYSMDHEGGLSPNTPPLMLQGH